MKTFDEVMELTRTVSSNTAFEDPECRAMYDCCLMVPEHHLIVEIGCQLGRSSSVIAQVAADRNLRTLHIDPYIENPEYLPAWIEMMHRATPEFAFLHMKSSSASQFVDAISLLFVDGDHEYAAVRNDLELFGPKVMSGGLLAMHDYGRDSLPDVYRAANDYFLDEEWDQTAIAGTLGVWRKK